MPFRLGAPELILILVIVVLLFGVGRISKISGEVGSAIKSFRKGISEESEEGKEPSETPPQEEEKKE